ncbi:hypothetical protein ADN00_12370 [Ornatilinea apprima]|uniref:DUF2029 domain-containing protein n=1 Tax=Ornatilinea apprima TaxID=1134406 RepID=A0A0P6X741_9CHLR|nr:glycosyltransferase 87 family protein [Ornatilinea apprima]KPL76127.1 hypothetical protein ADN00_12370 [Ornatilinea apprima]
MSSSQKYLTFFVGLLLLTAILAVAIHTLTAGNTIGADFMVFYLAGRSSFIEGNGPYTAENNLLSQLAINERPADPSEDQLTFSYPPYVLLAIFPLVYLPFTWAQAVWMALLLVLQILLPLFLFPRAPRWAVATSFLLYPITLGFILGNFAAPIGVFLLAVYAVLFNQEQSPSHIADALAGMGLAWCTAKPQFSWLIILFLLLAALKQRRWWLLGAFSCAMVTFLAASFLILPSWPVDWVSQVLYYAQTNRTLLHLTLLLQLVLPGPLSTALTPVLVGLALIGAGFVLYRWWQGKTSALAALSWVALITYLVHPRGVAYEQITFLIPFLLWVFTPAAPRLTLTRGMSWILAIAASWLGFYGARFASGYYALPEWILAFYVLWMILYLTHWQKAERPLPSQTTTAPLE